MDLFGSKQQQQTKKTLDPCPPQKRCKSDNNHHNKPIPNLLWRGTNSTRHRPYSLGGLFPAHLLLAAPKSSMPHQDDDSSNNNKRCKLDNENQQPQQSTMTFTSSSTSETPSSSTHNIPTSLLRRRVPNDHSCLFYALAYVCADELAPAPQLATTLRQVCAQAALVDPDPATRALFLGQPSVQLYAEWIRNPHNWGGENEIVILAAHYQMEVVVVSCETLSELSYNPGQAKGRVYILYTGQHYDPLVGVVAAEGNETTNENNNNDNQQEKQEQQPAGDDTNENSSNNNNPSSSSSSPPSTVPTADEHRRFPVGGGPHADVLLASALDVARQHNRDAAKRANEVSVKRIKCGGCGAILKNALEFQDHCMTVDHDDDFAYDCSDVEVVLQEGDPELEEFRKEEAAKQEKLKAEAAQRETEKEQQPQAGSQVPPSGDYAQEA